VSNGHEIILILYEVKIIFIISEKLLRIVKFYCNFGAIVKTVDYIANKNIFRQVLAGGLLVLFCVFQFVQYHHHHGNGSNQAASTKSSNIHPKCDICDFVAKKQNSHLEPIQITVPVTVVLPVSTSGFHYQTNWYFAYAILTDNKGPPSYI
jgi:hypothetical protein